MQIAILLATFNSSFYIKEQLDSLFKQTYKDFILYVRDDGSSDDTLSIVSDYKTIHKNIVILDDPIKGRRAMGSFMWMLEYVDADYYMFCDHDDVWLPTKIEESLNEILIIQAEDTPALVCTDLMIVNENLEIINDSMWNYMKLRPELLVQKRYATSCNLFTGCTMIINQKAKEISLPLSDKALMHDAWIGLRVMANSGAIGYISESQILYRQHGANVCGAQKIGGVAYVTNKILTINNILKSWMGNYHMARAALDNSLCAFSHFFWKAVYLIKR